jgi:light-regulated signal transduction histidine kinase (bacteriophytochrome)
LSRTNEELEAFNFIASHDLQEPLRKVQVYSNRIIENGTGQLAPSLQENFERINNASKRMQKLIEDFLAFSQTFKETQSPELIDLNAMLKEIIAELSTRLEEKGGHIEGSGLPTIFAVPFQMKQLLTNLISNAIKYTDPSIPPEIRVTGASIMGSEIPIPDADPEKRYISISVSDNGIGFEEKYSPKIFELFQRLHTKDVYSGTGIGLALCKKIVQTMNGFITAKSQPGKGSVFTFYLPVQTQL